jgi:hypothetical protein
VVIYVIESSVVLFACFSYAEAFIMQWLHFEIQRLKDVVLSLCVISSEMEKDHA